MSFLPPALLLAVSVLTRAEAADRPAETSLSAGADARAAPIAILPQMPLPLSPVPMALTTISAAPVALAAPAALDFAIVVPAAREFPAGLALESGRAVSAPNLDSGDALFDGAAAAEPAPFGRRLSRWFGARLQSWAERPRVAYRGARGALILPRSEPTAAQRANLQRLQKLV